MTKALVKLQSLRSEKGATAVEYGLMVALIAIVIIAAVALVGTNLDLLFDEVARQPLIRPDRRWSSGPAHGGAGRPRAGRTPDRSSPSQHFMQGKEPPIMTKALIKLQALRSEKGATAVEYGLMVALIAIVIIAAVALVGTNLDLLFDEVAASL